MTSEEVLACFKETGALLEGHFVYASGRHGRLFLQASRVLQYPAHTERLCRAMAELYAGSRVDMVVGPATGGIILAYETARHLGCRAAFAEKTPDGMAVKRGFSILPGTRTLVVEDIITTGGSVQQTIDHLFKRKAAVAGVAALVDRSGGAARFDVPFKALAQIDLETYPPDGVPEGLQAIPITEPDDLIV